MHHKDCLLKTGIIHILPCPQPVVCHLSSETVNSSRQGLCLYMCWYRPGTMNSWSCLDPLGSIVRQIFKTTMVCKACELLFILSYCIWRVSNLNSLYRMQKWGVWNANWAHRTGRRGDSGISQRNIVFIGSFLALSWLKLPRPRSGMTEWGGMWEDNGEGGSQAWFMSEFQGVKHEVNSWFPWTCVASVSHFNNLSVGLSEELSAGLTGLIEAKAERTFENPTFAL